MIQRIGTGSDLVGESGLWWVNACLRLAEVPRERRRCFGLRASLREPIFASLWSRRA